MTNLMLREPHSWLPIFQRQINQLLESPIGFDSGLLNTPGGPAVNVYETPDEFVLMAELPGWTRDQVNLNCENQTLTISGQRELANSDGRKYHRVEGFYGQFTRSFTVPGLVDVKSVAAELKDGVLTVHLPKLEQAKPRQIDVKIK